jgi:hypothetical protein
MTPTILRTHRDGCFEQYTNSWGTYLRPVEDPEATVIIAKEEFNKFELREDINRIPADLWQRWIQLCFYFVEKVPSQVEVSIRILRSESDPTQYRFLVPEQKVSMAAVKADDFNKAIDIETGEEITQYPPVGWIPVGSSHSHNTMQAFFSPTDDKYELSDPGIHIVIGSINKSKKIYNLKASVVANYQRFDIPYDRIIDASPIDDCTFHEKVVTYVDYSPPKPSIKKSAGFISSTSSYNRNTYQQWHKDKFSQKKEEWEDPFFYTDGFDDGCTEFWSTYQEGTLNEKVKEHQVEDIIIDYMKQNYDDVERMSDLASLLMSYVDDIKEQIETSEPICLQV